MFAGSEVTSQMVMVVPTSVDHWPTGVSYTPSLVNTDVPHIGPVYAGPDCFDTCSYVDVQVVDEMGEVLLDGDLLCQIFQHLFEPAGPVCSRDGCPCTSTYQGIEGQFCCRACYMGRACTINYHRTPFQPRSTIRPPLVALVCSTWREAWDEAQTSWVRRPYPAAMLWMQGLVRDVSTRAYHDADRLEREAAARRDMGVVDEISTTQLIANMVAQEGNLYAAARVHQRRLDTAVAVEPTTTSLALAVLSMRSTDTSPQRTLALQVHHSTWPMPEAWPLEHVAAVVGEVIEHPMMVDDAVDDLAIGTCSASHDGRPCLPSDALVVSLSDRDSIDGMSNTHPRLLQTHDGLAADAYIHQSAIPHAGVGLHTRRAVQCW